MLAKVIKVLKSDNALQRTVLFINKTDYLRDAFKVLQNITHPQMYLKRNSGFKETIENEFKSYAEKLNEQGYLDVSHLMDPSALKSLDQYGTERLQTQNQISTETQDYGKKIWLRLSDLDKKLTSSHPLIQISTQEKILKILAAYFEKPAFLDYVLMTLSSNDEGTEKLTQSQLWHFDRDDHRVVKLFVYLTDVDQVEKGPFTLFSKPNSQTFPYNGINRYWTDEEIYSKLPVSELIQMKAPKLSAFLVCTDQCLHMGSRLKKGYHRLMTTSTYITLPASHPWAGSRVYEIDSKISEIQRLALQKI